MSREKVALLGPAETVKPFSALGVNCFELEDAGKTRDLLAELAGDETTGLILIAEKLAAELLPEIEKIKRQMLPAVFILPGYKTKTNLGLRRLENTLARAVGRAV
jgi:vacuolar-type H+-ATPase subunit F/Vma7